MERERESADVAMQRESADVAMERGRERVLTWQWGRERDGERERESADVAMERERETERDINWLLP